MAIKITKRKTSPFWQLRGTVKGQTIFEPTGIPHAGRKTPPLEVRKLRDKREQELERSGLATFETAANLYLAAGGSPRFIQPIVDKIGSVFIHQVDQALIDKTAIEIYPDCSPATRNRQFYTPFISVWSRASMGQNAMCPPVKWGRPIGTGYLQQVRKPTDYKSAVKFINACPLHAGKIMFFLFWTGCRPAEALNLECEDVDIKGRWAVLRDTKTGEPRGIPLHRCLVPMMKEEIKKGGKVFRTSKGEPYAQNKKLNKTGRIISQGGPGFATVLKDARKETGLHITPYTARHTVATYLDDKVPAKRKDAILGHSRDIAGHYVSLSRADLIEAIDKLPMPDKIRTELYPCNRRATKNKVKIENE
jgi:integrase/recombinase XerD